MDPNSYPGNSAEEKESMMWRDWLLRALPHVDMMKELYQEWIKATPDDQRNTKQSLVNHVRGCMEGLDGSAKARTYRLAYYLVQTFDHWTAVQDMMGACGVDSSLMTYQNSFQNDLYNMVILLQDTLSTCVKEGKASETVVADDGPKTETRGRSAVKSSTPAKRESTKSLEARKQRHHGDEAGPGKAPPTVEQSESSFYSKTVEDEDKVEAEEEGPIMSAAGDFPSASSSSEALKGTPSTNSLNMNELEDSLDEILAAEVGPLSSSSSSSVGGDPELPVTDDESSSTESELSVAEQELAPSSGYGSTS